MVGFAASSGAHCGQPNSLGRRSGTCVAFAATRGVHCGEDEQVQFAKIAATHSPLITAFISGRYTGRVLVSSLLSPFAA